MTSYSPSVLLLLWCNQNSQKTSKKRVNSQNLFCSLKLSMPLPSALYCTCLCSKMNEVCKSHRGFNSRPPLEVHLWSSLSLPLSLSFYPHLTLFLSTLFSLSKMNGTDAFVRQQNTYQFTQELKSAFVKDLCSSIKDSGSKKR